MAEVVTYELEGPVAWVTIRRPEKRNALNAEVRSKLWEATHRFNADAQAKVLVLDQEAAAVLEVVQGKVGGFIYDQMSTYQNWKRNAETTRAILEPFQTESWAVGARLEDKELVAKVNSFLSTFRAQKGFEALGDRFLREQKDAFRALGYPFFF